MQKIQISSSNDNIDFLKNYHEIKKNNITENVLSKYEITSIIGLRATQISKGAQPLIEVPKNMTDVVEIAELELDQRKTPFLIERDLTIKKGLLENRRYDLDYLYKVSIQHILNENYVVMEYHHFGQ